MIVAPVTHAVRDTRSLCRSAAALSRHCIIDATLADFVRERATLIVAMATDAGIPELGMALGCLCDEGGDRLALVFDTLSAAPLMDLVRAGGDRVSLVASRPSDLRTMQIKGSGATLTPFPVAATAELARTIRGRRDELARIEFGDPYAGTLYDHHPERLICLSFRAEAVFEQTPGPKAGQALTGSP